MLTVSPNMALTLPYNELCRVITSACTGDEDDLGPLTPHTEEYFRREFDIIKREVGATFAEMFFCEAAVDRLWLTSIR